MRRLGLILLLALAAAGSGAEAAQTWIRNVPAAGFSVDQPVGWTPVAGPPDRLTLVNFPCRGPGGALCEGQAEVSVRSEPGAPKVARTQACWNLAETVTDAQVGPGRRAQTTALTCTIGSRRFTIIERHWKGDRHAANYERISMRMAKSLRYPAKPPPTKPMFRLP